MKAPAWGLAAAVLWSIRCADAMRVAKSAPGAPDQMLQGQKVTIADKDWEVGVTEPEFDQWWSQPISAENINWNHFESGYTPEEMKMHPVPAQYTRGWRHGRFLHLLKAWRDLAAQLGVGYWIDFGALLGIMRYEGKHLIPWDNDADIGILQSEFERLNATLNAEGREGILRGGELGLPPDVIVTSRQVEAPGIRAKTRLEIIPGRVVDTTTGFFLDIFPFYEVEGGYLQHWWDFPYFTIWCDDRTTNALEEWSCRPPCKHTYCWMRRTSAIFPTVPCHLEGVGELRCPQNSTQVLTRQYTTPFYSNHYWNASIQDFVPYFGTKA